MALSDLLLRLAALWGEQQMKKYELNQRLKVQKELMKLQEEMRQKALNRQSLEKRLIQMTNALVKSGKVTLPQELYQYILQQTGDPTYAKEFVNRYSWLLDVAKYQNDLNATTNKMINYYNQVMMNISNATRYYSLYLKMKTQQQDQTDMFASNFAYNILPQMINKAQAEGKTEVVKRLRQQMEELTQKLQKSNNVVDYFYERAKEYWINARNIFKRAQLEWFTLPEDKRQEVMMRALQIRRDVDLSIFNTSFDDNPLFTIDPMNFGITDEKTYDKEHTNDSTDDGLPTDLINYLSEEEPQIITSSEKQQNTENTSENISEVGYPYTEEIQRWKKHPQEPQYDKYQKYMQILKDQAAGRELFFRNDYKWHNMWFGLDELLRKLVHNRKFKNEAYYPNVTSTEYYTWLNAVRPHIINGTLVGTEQIPPNFYLTPERFNAIVNAPSYIIPSTIYDDWDKYVRMFEGWR